KMGSLKDIFEKMPFFGGGLPEGVNLDDRELTKIEAIISSMTNEERRRPEKFVVTSWEEIVKEGKKFKRKSADYDPRRVRRVASGSGRTEVEVKELLHKFASMRQMMVQLGASTGLLGKIPGFKQFAQMKKLAQMDLGSVFGEGGPSGGAGDAMAAMPGMAGGPGEPGVAGVGPPPGGAGGAQGGTPPGRKPVRDRARGGR